MPCAFVDLYFNTFVNDWSVSLNYDSYNDFNIGGELLFGKKRAIKSKAETRRLFEEFHSSPMGGHRGIRKTTSDLCSRFYWYGMTTDVEKFKPAWSLCTWPHSGTVGKIHIRLSQKRKKKCQWILHVERCDSQGAYHFASNRLYAGISQWPTGLVHILVSMWKFNLNLILILTVRIF